MSWDSRYEKFGLIKVHIKTVKVYRDFYNYVILNVSEVVQSAAWSSHILNITLSNGKVLHYKDRNDHDGI